MFRRLLRFILPAKWQRNLVYLRDLAARLDQIELTALFVEHDMSVVFGISQKIRVMHLGQIIATGKPEEIRSDTQVQQIYLGEE